MTDPRVIDTTKRDDPMVITHPSGSTTTITPDGQIIYSASQVGEIDTVAVGDPIETVPLNLTKIPTIEVPNDFVGVAPMAAPSGLVFALKTNGDTVPEVLTPDKISDTAVAADFQQVAAVVAAQEAAKPLRYTAKIEFSCTSVKSNAETFAGLAAYEDFSIHINYNDKWFAYISCNIWRLNEQNTVPANRFLQAKIKDDSLTIVAHDVLEADFVHYLPKKVQDLLDKLNG